MEGGICSFAGLAFAQVIFYKIRLEQAKKLCLMLWGMYFALFLILRASRALEIPAPFGSGIPLLLFAFLFTACKLLKRFDFYLYSGIWAGMIQMSSPAGGAVVNGLLESLLAAFLLPLAAAVNERLELSDIPEKWAGLPVLLIAGGILALALKFVF